MFSFLILREMKFSHTRSTLLTLLFIFENGFTSIGRLILLDSYMLSFTACVAYFLTRLFYRSFRTLDLFYLGASLGMVLSVKWIGCLTTAFVGLLIIREILGQAASKQPLKSVAYNFGRFALYLIILPILFYVALFFVHFQIVNNSSSDDGHMSSIFQASLNGNNYKMNRKYISFGTRVTIKSQIEGGGGYLHSHDHKYPNSESSNFNQITTYSHKDENNSWVIQKVTEKTEDALFVGDGDELVFYHLETKKYLSVEEDKAYLSDGLLVSASPRPLSHKNVFTVEIYKDTRKSEKHLKSLTTLFKIRHKETGAYLSVSGEKYPSWGFEQGEVVAIQRQEKIKDNSILWNVEENTSDKISEDVNPIYTDIYKNLFFRNFIEHNIVMYKTNKSFVQDDDLEPERIVSRPYEWPFLRRGLRMCSWDSKALKFYMFGNPLVWYTATLCVLIAPLKFIFRCLKFKRCGKTMAKSEGFVVFLSFGGWCFHYLPFFLVGRVLYFHHYYPALFFSIFSIGYMLKGVRLEYLKIYVLACVVSYLLYSGLTYGFVNEHFISKLKIVPTWDY
jgi:dolichyl-phosphate-mannose-protein mannosyltransferase